jgi:menaquinone-dependent protoporphyrinogen oxidase
MKVRIIFLAMLLLNSCHSHSKPFESKQYGNSINSKGKVLVTFATRAGSTIEVADSIAHSIAKQGYCVTLMHIDEVGSLTDYSAVVIGSAIRMGSVTPEVKRFVEERRDELERVPTAYFITCLTLKDDTPENREAVKKYLEPLRKMVTPFAEGYFAGKMDYSKLKPLDRFMAKRMVKAPEGDFRDWGKIYYWSKNLMQLH